MGLSWAIRLSWDEGGSRPVIQLLGVDGIPPIAGDGFEPVEERDHAGLTPTLIPLAASMTATIAAGYRESPAAGARATTSLLAALMPRTHEELNPYSTLLVAVASAAARTAKALVDEEQRVAGTSSS